MTNRIRMRHLRCFLQLAKHRSVTRAAEQLNTVQPSVSRTLKELESELGVELFHRSPSGLTLTKAGNTLHGYVKNGLLQIDQGLEVLKGKSHHQQVVICALPNVVRVLMPNVIAKFKSFYPEIDISLQTNVGANMLDGLRNGHVDFMVGRLMAPSMLKGMNFEHLYHEPLVFACRTEHPLAKKHSVMIEDINQYEIIIPSDETIIRTELDRYMLSKGLARFSNVIETISFEFSRNYIQQTDAIVCQPKGTIRQELEQGNVVMLDTVAEELMGSVGLTTIVGKTLSHPANLMKDIIRKEVVDLGLA
ncbi:MAG: LysR family transcriptional regulator [Rhizobiaceae bacterium]|nr:LysR family transcriptional regulator [Rhizobiaceae bacterium]